MKPSAPHPLDALTAALSTIEPTDTISTAGRKIILADAIRLLALEDGVRLSDDPEFIHDMRVATRRMRTLLQLLGQYYHPKRVKKLVRSLRWQAQLLGRVRDLDVLLEDLFLRDRTGLHHPISTAKAQRDRMHRKLVSGLASKKFKTLADRLMQFALDPDDLLANSAPLPVEVRHIVPILLHQQLAAVRGFDPLFTDDAHPDYQTLHALRIAFKQLRYATAYFGDVLGASADAFITEIKAVQDHLGRLNDVVVFADHLRTHVETRPDDEALKAALVDLETEASTLAQSFIQAWHRFNSRIVQKHLADALLVLR